MQHPCPPAQQGCPTRFPREGTTRPEAAEAGCRRAVGTDPDFIDDTIRGTFPSYPFRPGLPSVGTGLVGTKVGMADPGLLPEDLELHRRGGSDPGAGTARPGGIRCSHIHPVAVGGFPTPGRAQ